MMTMNKLMAFLTVWAIALLFCNIADGMFLGSYSTGMAAWLDQTMGFGVSAAGGGVTAVVSPSFLGSLRTVFLWDYKCFEGGMVVVRIFMLLWSTVGTFGLAQVVLNSVSGLIR